MTIPHGLCKAYVRMQSSLEIVVIQRGPLHKSHNMAKGIPGQSEKNQKVLKWKIQLNQILQPKLTKASKDLCLHDSQRERGQMMAAISLFFLFYRKIACTNESNHTSHWNRCQEKFSSERKQIENIASKFDQKVQ